MERARILEYRSAVEEASQTSVEASFDRLERLGAITEAGLERLRDELANAYVDLAAKRESAIVVSQTRAEIEEVNERIRRALRQRGLLAGVEERVTSLRQVDLTTAQKNDQRYYPEDHVVVFNQNIGRCQRGDIGRLRGILKRGVVIDSGPSLHVIKAEDLDAISVCRPAQLILCRGDRLQLKANSLTSKGAKLANGEIVTVSKIRRSGDIVLRDGRTLPASYRQFVRGYAVTSYGSQGKTVDHVLLADSACRAATNSQQWYVSISRGRRSVRIFTPDKADLRRHIARSGDRELALSLNLRRKERIAIRRGLLRQIKPGRSFAKAICLIAMRSWTTAFIKSRRELNHEIRNHQTSRTARAHVLAA